MPVYILWLIIGIEGFVALAAQMLTIRQLMPFVGNSVVVTSLIIGLFLLALAMGYWRGGQIIYDGAQRLMRNFLCAGAWLGIGLSYVFLAYWFFWGQQITHLPLYALLLGYLLIVTVFPVYWLGQTVPIVMNLWESKQHAGVIGGRVLQLSTLGSFLGAVLTSLVVMNWLGLGWTVFISASALLILSSILALKDKSFIWILLSGLLIAFIYWLNVLGTARLFVATNNYAQYQVIEPFIVENKSGKLLIINNSTSSFVATDGEAFPYIEKIKSIIFDDIQLKNESILVLGAGGFTFSAQETYGNEVTYVDIDPNIDQIVKEHYLKTDDTFVPGDARVFVQQTEDRFPVIIIDAYSHQLTIPSHLLTVEFFAGVNRALSLRGHAIFNMVIDPLLNDPYSRSIDGGLRAVFKQCVSMPLHYLDKSVNVIYVCEFNEQLDMNKVLSAENPEYYTDDHNRATWDMRYLKT